MPTSPRRASWLAGFLVAAWIAVLIGFLTVLGRDLAENLCIPVFGACTPRAHDTPARWPLLTLGIAALAVPLYAIVLALVQKRRKVAAAWLLPALIGLVAMAMALGHGRNYQPVPPDPARSTHCVERSGGDTRCPGG